MAVSSWKHYTITGVTRDEKQQYWFVAVNQGFMVVISQATLPQAPRIGDSLSINGYDGQFITACAYGEKLLWDDRQVTP